MKIHEYQGRALFEEYGIPCPPSALAESAEDASRLASEYAAPVVVKAQVLSGGRGKAGGVKLAETPEEAAEKFTDIMGLEINSLTVEKILITPAADIKQEFYVGLAMDRAAQTITLMLSGEGGVEIETLAVEQPDKIHKIPIHPAGGFEAIDIDDVLQQVFETPERAAQAKDIIANLYRLFVEKDCSIAEINPLILNDEDQLLAIDSKINFDDNGLVKHPELEELQNDEEYSADELQAKDVGLSFVSMDGNIGCIVNGAGLAMATMDLIKHFGGSPANFLDVGGSSNPEKVLNALKIILNNSNVKAILINIFGGITRCDDIAKGILMAVEQTEIPVPMVIRLIGTNDAEGRKLLEDAGFTCLDDLSEAVKQVVSKL